MGNFFLAQRGDVLTEGVCFDTSLVRGKGGSSVWRASLLRRSACADLAPSDKGKVKDRSPVGLRLNNCLFYFRRFWRALLALSTPLSDSLALLPFFSPDTLSLAAFVAASLTFFPMSAMLITLL